MASIAHLLTQGPTLSFEFNSPRDAEGERRLTRTLNRLAAINPSFMSVTYGPSGATRGPTEEVVHRIQHEVGVTAMPHLTCVAHTQDEVGAILERYRRDSVENLLALHGDLPEGAPEVPSDHFTLAKDLVAYVRQHTPFSIGVAAHPEGHPKAATREADLSHQARKLADADFAITQFFYRVEHYERFVEELAVRGVNTPVIPGIMPPANPDLVGRMAAMNNAEFPAELREYLEANADDAELRRAYAVEVSTRLCESLIKAGAPGLHLYTMNFSQTSLEIVRNLGLRETSGSSPAPAPAQPRE